MLLYIALQNFLCKRETRATLDMSITPIQNKKKKKHTLYTTSKTVWSPKEACHCDPNFWSWPVQNSWAWITLKKIFNKHIYDLFKIIMIIITHRRHTIDRTQDIYVLKLHFRKAPLTTGKPSTNPLPPWECWQGSLLIGPSSNLINNSFGETINSRGKKKEVILLCKSIEKKKSFDVGSQMVSYTFS